MYLLQNLIINFLHQSLFKFRRFFSKFTMRKVIYLDKPFSLKYIFVKN